MATREWKREVHIRDNFTCQHCGAKEDPKHITFQVHHIVFKCKGGSSSLDNLMLLCPLCHRILHKMCPTSRKQRRKKKKKHHH